MSENQAEEQAAKNLSIVRTFYDRLYAGDVDAIPTMLSEDFTWLVGTESDELTAAIPWAGRTLRGRDGFRELVETLFSEFDSQEFEAREFHPASDHVLVQGHFRFQHKKTRKVAVSDWVARFDLADGEISGGQFFENTFAVASARS